MEAKINGQKALFCGESCRDGFREDRKHGVIYGAFFTETEPGSGVYTAESWESGTLKRGLCAYCKSEVK